LNPKNGLHQYRKINPLDFTKGKIKYFKKFKRREANRDKSRGEGRLLAGHYYELGRRDIITGSKEDGKRQGQERPLTTAEKGVPY